MLRVVGNRACICSMVWNSHPLLDETSTLASMPLLGGNGIWVPNPPSDPCNGPFQPPVSGLDGKRVMTCNCAQMWTDALMRTADDRSHVAVA